MAATVYLVTNTRNGHTYVGVTRFAVEARWAQHVYTASRTPRSYLHRAIAKYGADAFTVEPVASCLSEPSSVERMVIEQRAPIYNQTNGGEITVGRRIPREVSERIRRANIGKTRTPEQNAANSARKRAEWAGRDPQAKAEAIAALGRARLLVDRSKQREASRASAKAYAWSAESRAKLSASCMGRRHTPDVLARIAAKHMKAVECVELKTVFDSMSEAAEATGVSITSVSRVCLGKRASANGLTFELVSSL